MKKIWISLFAILLVLTGCAQKEENSTEVEEPVSEKTNVEAAVSAEQSNA